MKKFLNLILITALFSLNACADKKEVITFAQLPMQAQEIVKQNFDVATISYVMKERDWSVEYEVRFNNGNEVDFDSEGQLKKVDCQLTQVPEALIPQPVLTYVKTNFPGAFIQEWGRDDRGYKAELNNGLELKFDSSYRFSYIDD